MPATSTMPWSRPSAAAIEQLYVTHCLFDEGVYRQAGFTVRASSTSDPLLRRFALEYPPYELPAGMPDATPAPAAAPRRLALVRIPGGRSALIHSAYVPDDGSGRPNNFLSHVLVHSTLMARQALTTWASSDWVGRCPAAAGTDLPPLANLPRPGPVNDEAVTAFLQPIAAAEDQDLATLTCPQRLAAAPRRRRELVALALRGCQLALQAGPASARGRFVVLAEPGLTALLLYAAARLLPESLAANLTFSTYENAHRDLRSYRHARVVGTYAADPHKGLEEELYTTRGYALDTFNHRFSPELGAEEDLPIEEWVEVAARGEWAVIDKVHRLQGHTNGSLVSFRDGLQAAKLSSCLAAGKMEVEDLLTLKRLPQGPALLEQHRDKVWALIRDGSLVNTRMREEFAHTLREHVSDLEDGVARALRAQTPQNWLPHWRLLCSVLQDDAARRREAIQKILPEPPYPSALRFALLRELHTLQMSPVDQRQPGHALLRGCSRDDLEQFARSDLPREWFVWALCHAIARRESRVVAVRHLHAGTDELLRTFCGQLRLLKDEDLRRAILAGVFSPSDPERVHLFSRLLKQHSALPPGTLEWLLDWLGALTREFADFWCQEDHLGHLLEMLREAGDGAAPIWDRLSNSVKPEVLLPGNFYQQTLLANLAAARHRPGAVIPQRAAQAIADWTLLHEHFEKACAVPEHMRQGITDACTRRGLDPVAILHAYFARFVLPHGMKKEVLDDFAGFYHSFCPAGTEYQDYSSRLIGWLQMLGSCPESTVAAYQRYYLENFVPVQFRWRLADEMQQAGKLLRGVLEAVPRPTKRGEVSAEGSETSTAADSTDLYQLAGVHSVDGQPCVTIGAALRRSPWILCSLAGGMAAAFVCGLHRAQLQHVAGLALYVPVVLALAQTMAAQSASLAVAAVRRQRAECAALLRALAKELLTGVLLALACALVLGGLTAALGWPVRLALCLGATVAGGGAGAALLGVALPVLLARVRWGSRIAAGPVTGALAGVLALMVYLALARWLLG